MEESLGKAHEDGREEGTLRGRILALTIHEVQDEAEFVRCLEGIRHAHDEGAILAGIQRTELQQEKKPTKKLHACAHCILIDTFQLTPSHSLPLASLLYILQSNTYCVHPYYPTHSTAHTYACFLQSCDNELCNKSLSFWPHKLVLLLVLTLYSTISAVCPASIPT